VSSQDVIDVVVPAFNRRDEAVKCVESLLASKGVEVAVVVVDNGSSDGTSAALDERFGDRIRVVRSEVNLYAGGARNLGAEQGRARYILFVDSDNVVDPLMAAELVAGMEGQVGERIGLCGPLMYHAEHPDRLCWVGGDISLWTSLTWWRGRGEKDQGQYLDRRCIKVGHIPNIFMVERLLFEEVGGFDMLYKMHYEESDLAERLRRMGYACVLFPKAKSWHNIPIEKPKGDKQFRGANRDLLYLSVRNRILFMKRFASVVQLAAFCVLFSPLLLAYQLVMSGRNGRFDLWGLIVLGYRDGWREKIDRM
jgi:GT2 family glycosyltransferase